MYIGKLPCSIILCFSVIWSLECSLVGAEAGSGRIAAIFGFGNRRENVESNETEPGQQTQNIPDIGPHASAMIDSVPPGETSHYPPPPPPPPPVKQADAEDWIGKKLEETDGDSTDVAKTVPPGPPPPPPHQAGPREQTAPPPQDPVNPQQEFLPEQPQQQQPMNHPGQHFQMDPPSQTPKPPPHNEPRRGTWMEGGPRLGPMNPSQMVGRNMPTRHPPPPAFVIQRMKYDLDMAFQREQSLKSDFRNLTARVANLRQREDLQLRQLDVLTERVMESEAKLAAEHNESLQHQRNCTELAKSVALLQGDLEGWKKRCSQGVKALAKFENETVTLKKRLQKATRKAEDLATMVEINRLNDEEKSTGRGEKKLGFFAWLFSWGDVSGSSDEDLEVTRREAKSTLLDALQRERKNVEELEALISNLERNNSAIAIQVKSRDEVIEELNDRISVFEEDKVVLKAALRQLKKDMSEEIPKKQSLVKQLEDSTIEINRLEKQLEGLIADHEEEIRRFQDAIDRKVEQLAAAESNLTTIGTYVHRLEERLGDFAVARREIEEREKACRDVEVAYNESKEAKATIEEKLADLQKEYDELRGVFEEVIQARSLLKGDFDALEKERNALVGDRDALNAKVDMLVKQMEHLEIEKSALTSRYITLQKEYNETAAHLEKIESQSVSSDTFQDMVAKLDSLESNNAVLAGDVTRYQEQEQAAVRESIALVDQLKEKEDELMQAEALLDQLAQASHAKIESVQEDSSHAKSQLTDAERRLADLEEQVQMARESEQDARNLLEETEALVSKLTAENATYEAEKEAIRVELTAKDAEIAKLIAENKAQRETIAAQPEIVEVSEPTHTINVSEGMVTRKEDGPTVSFEGKPHEVGGESMLENEGVDEHETWDSTTMTTVNETIDSSSSFGSLSTIDSSLTLAMGDEELVDQNDTESGNVADVPIFDDLSKESVAFPHKSEKHDEASSDSHLVASQSLEKFRPPPPRKIGQTKKFESTVERKVPFRGIRKALSKRTGVRGLLTEPSRRERSAPSSVRRPPRLPPQGKVKGLQARPPLPSNSTSSAAKRSPTDSTFAVPSLPPAANASDTAGASVPKRSIPTHPSSNHTSTAPERKVLLRGVRKWGAKMTGVHGLFTKPSKPRRRLVKQPPRNEKRPAKSPSMPASLRPDAVKQSIDGTQLPKESSGSGAM